MHFQHVLEKQCIILQAYSERNSHGMSASITETLDKGEEVFKKNDDIIDLYENTFLKGMNSRMAAII